MDPSPAVPLHTERFTGRAAIYARYRERYAPEIVLPLLREWCGLTPAWTIADVGAGTGMLSDVFLANSNRVLAVEPNREMREACQYLHLGEDRLAVRAGTAEATGLPAQAAEMVAVGRALHWFDLPRALEEFRRILRPGGWVTTIAFGRSEGGAEENLAVEALLRTMTEEHRSSHEGYSVYRELAGHFPAAFHQREIRQQKSFTWDQLRGLVLSLSHAPLPEDPRSPAFVQQLRTIFDRFACDGHFRLATRYWINAGRFAE